MVSYVQIIDRIETASNQHLQLNYFGEGDTSQIVEVESTDIVYPMLWVADNPHTIQDKSMYYNLTLYFLDKVKQDRSNERDVISDMTLVALDFIGILNNLAFVGESATAYLDKGQSIRLTPVTEEFADRVAGVLMDIRIKQPYEWSRCYVPTSGNTTCN